MRNRIVLAVAFLCVSVALAQSGVPPEVSSVVSAGYWQANGQSGTYRVVVTSQGWEHVTSRVLVEWLAEAKELGQSPTVLSVVEPPLPFGQSVAALTAKLKPISSGCAELSISGVISAEPSQKVSATLIATEPGRIERKAANPSIEGTCPGKPGQAPHVKR